MNGLLPEPLAGEEALGVALALALVVALRFGLPDGGRRLLRQPLVLLAAHLGVVAVDRLLPAGASAHRFLHPLALLLVLGSMARSAVLLVLDVLLGRRRGRPLPRILRDIGQGLVYAGVLFAALDAAGVSPGSLFTTSAVLTAVIGLSLQETLGNLFAGLAIQVQQPFQVGDWIQFDAEPKHIGRVVEINWRATRVITLDEVEVTVPNASLAKAPIRNFTKPTAVSRRSVYVAAPYAVPPLEVQRTILAAIADAPGVVKDPPPSVVTNLFGEYGIEYWVRFYTDQFHRRDGVDGAVRDRIWYALRRADVEIPYPHRTLEVHQVTEESSARETARLLDDRGRALRCVDIFRVLSDEELRRLAELTQRRLYAPGEVIVRQGDDSTELYIIEDGEVTVSVQRVGGQADGGHDGGSPASVEVARLGRGKFFGEMALVTGDKRQATVRAATACQLLGVGREAVRPIMEKAPDLAERISAVLSERQAQLDVHAAAPEERHEHDARVQKDLLERIKKFFAL
jgi:small-conductance mechanosensitive channel/CRP-like cAMP-binding protein